MQYLLAAKANPDSTDRCGAQPLDSCRKGWPRAGDRPAPSRRWGGQPLDDASKRGHAACAKLLEAAGATRGAGAGARGGVAAAGAPSSAGVVESLACDMRDVKLLEKIGSGGFGDIFRATWRGTPVACKRIRADLINEEKRVALQDLAIEVTHLQQLRHPNICMLLGYSTSENNPVMLSELMRCSLLDVLRAGNVHGGGKPALSKRRSVRYAVQLAQGMNYLHTCKPPIMHRDLKPANLLVDFSGTLKVSDFGLAKLRPAPSARASDAKAAFMTGETGSYRFMAPEVFRHEEYDESVDVYSFSMILFYMLRGMPPFLHLGGVDAAVAAAIRQERPPIPRAWDEKITHLLQAAWSENPASRPSFQKAREAHDRPLSAHLWQARVTSPPRPLLAGPRHAPRVLQGQLQGLARGRPQEGGGREPRQGVRHLLSRAGATARRGREELHLWWEAFRREGKAS